MITAKKHLDLNRSVLRVAATVLAKLRLRRVMRHEQLMVFIKDKVGDDADVIVAPALNFLFLVGRLEYHAKTDSFEYIEPDRV